ncbi:hypothetical protein GCM10023116_26020 [Kistimonas scapharcae]|uniref:Uncharacterized protein n=1 Tax=Kistimonas scapharcae TaxID=1036133 RepID=A0ABP8V2T3_9GAMM
MSTTPGRGRVLTCGYKAEKHHFEKVQQADDAAVSTKANTVKKYRDFYNDVVSKLRQAHKGA